MSTRVEHAQTKLINYYSPALLSQPPASSHLRLIVALRPSQPPFSYALSVFCWFFKKQYLQPSKCHWYEPVAFQQSLPLHEHETINAPDRKDVLLTGQLPMQKGRCKRGKGWPRPGAFVETKIPSFFAIVVASSS